MPKSNHDKLEPRLAAELFSCGFEIFAYRATQ